MVGTPQMEAESIISMRMEKFIKETPGGANASANKGSGADNKLISDTID